MIFLDDRGLSLTQNRRKAIRAFQYYFSVYLTKAMASFCSSGKTFSLAEVSVIPRQGDGTNRLSSEREELNSSLTG